MVNKIINSILTGTLEDCYVINNSYKNREDAEGNCIMGLIYLNGYGVKKNEILGLNKLTKSAEKKNPNGLYHLGLYYYKNNIYNKAFELLSELKNLEENNSEVEFMLADMYYNGFGTQQNKKLGIQMYNTAQILGSNMAINKLNSIENEKYLYYDVIHDGPLFLY